MVIKSDLQKYLDTKKVETRLLGHVERHLLKRPLSERSTTVLHPSEIVKPDWCHKYAYYLLTGGTPVTEKPSLRLQNIFDEGHAIHRKWQSRFAEMGVLFGEWKCLVCEEITEGTAPVSCGKCNSNLVEYNEVTLRDSSLRMSGHTDGWIRDLGEDCLIEIKSIGAGTLRAEAPELLYDAEGDLTKAWKNIRRPFRSHMLQGQVYLELAHRMFGEDAPKEIVFIYELKADQDFKEFVVKADYEIIQKLFNSVEKLIEQVEIAISPECNISIDGCKYCNAIGK